MLYLLELLWDKICSKNLITKKNDERKPYAYIDKVHSYDTFLYKKDDDISDYGQYVEIDKEYYRCCN